MDIIELRRRLHDLCEEEGSVQAWSNAKHIAHSYVCSVIRGNTKPGRKILKAMGLRKSFSAKKTTVMKFEDITN